MLNESNAVHLQGIIIGQGKLSHETHGENFYEYKLKVNRKSGAVDILPVLISERLIDRPLNEGDLVSINGQMRSYNQIIGNVDGKLKTKLILNIFAVDFVMPVAENLMNPNTIKLKGYLCKQPVLRETSLTKKEVCDVLIAVNRQYNKSDYIPCLAWGRNAKYLSRFKVGDEIKIEGRIQSREYVKKISETESETRIAYEVSIANITKVTEAVYPEYPEDVVTIITDTPEDEGGIDE